MDEAKGTNTAVDQEEIWSTSFFQISNSSVK